MTSNKRREVTKIWTISQMVKDNFGVEESLFSSYVKYSTIFDMLTNKLLL